MSSFAFKRNPTNTVSTWRLLQLMLKVLFPTDCVMISLDEGVFHYRSKGLSTTCGLFFLAEPDKTIRITIEYLNVNCAQEGLVSVSQINATNCSTV